MLCETKSSFYTKSKAKKYKKRAEKKVWKKLHIYKCDKCWLYHYTSKGIETITHFRNLKKRVWVNIAKNAKN